MENAMKRRRRRGIVLTASGEAIDRIRQLALWLSCWRVCFRERRF
jgi:hypothetical protein